VGFRLEETETFGLDRLPKRYLSVDRFLIVVAGTILLSPTVFAVLGFFYRPTGSSGGIDEISFFELLPSIIVVQYFAFLYGWLAWVPLIPVAVILGMPVWIRTMLELTKRKVRPWIAVVAAASCVVIVTILATGLGAQLYYQSADFAAAKFYLVFLVPALIVGLPLASVIYAR
jgi:hypothetical protein